ncbi:8084_t:CDS:2, partial [Racocetra fulgida]
MKYEESPEIFGKTQIAQITHEQSLTPVNILQMTPAITGEYGTVRQSSTSANVLQMTPAIAGECCIECCPVAAAEAAQAAITMRDSGPNRDSESNNTDHTANEPRHSSFLWTAQDLQHGCKWQGCYLRFETHEELTGHVSEGHIGC